MSAVNNFINKLWRSLGNLCYEYGMTDDDIGKGLKKTAEYLKKIDFEDKDYVVEVCEAIDQEISNHKTEKAISLSDEEVTTLQNILNHAYDGTVLTTNKPVTKAELDSLKKNIGSIKKKLK